MAINAGFWYLVSSLAPEIDMADKFNTIPIGPSQGIQDHIKKRFKYMDDGTYAEVIASALINSDGSTIEFGSVDNTQFTDPSGNPLNSIFLPGTPATNLNDICFQIDTTYVGAVLWYFSSSGSGYNLIAEGTWDGSSWNTMQVLQLNVANSPTRGTIGPSASPFALDTLGAIAIRLRISSVGTGGPIQAYYRTLMTSLPVELFMASTTFAITSALAIGAALSVIARACFVTGYGFTNVTNAFRYVKVVNNTTANLGTSTPTILIGIPPNETIAKTFSGKGIPHGSQVAMGIYTDAACTVFATVGDVIGTLEYSG